MSYKNKTYVIFDGDEDMWAYNIMKAWKKNDNIDFNFYDAHDINNASDDSLTDSIKQQLRDRMKNAKQVIVLVGEKTKNLRKFVPWEINLARVYDLPIVVVNLNRNRQYDSELCPRAIGSEIYTIHVSFQMKIIKYALDNFPSSYENYKDEKKGNYWYKDSVYEDLDL